MSELPPDSEWRQGGSISGEKYDMWFRYLNGYSLVVHLGTATGKWYKSVNGGFRGSSKSFEGAKADCEREARGEGAAWNE